MGDIIRAFDVRVQRKKHVRRLRLYFDSGSPRTFVKLSAAHRLGQVMELPTPRTFAGLGNGQFQATHAVDVEFRFLGLWCPFLAYVVPDDVLEGSYDILVGHDLMQLYDIRLEPRRRRVGLDRDALRLALHVRGVARPRAGVSPPRRRGGP